MPTQIMLTSSFDFRPDISNGFYKHISQPTIDDKEFEGVHGVKTKPSNALSALLVGHLLIFQLIISFSLCEK